MTKSRRFFAIALPNAACFLQNYRNCVTECCLFLRKNRMSRLQHVEKGTKKPVAAKGKPLAATFSHTPASKGNRQTVNALLPPAKTSFRNSLSFHCPGAPTTRLPHRGLPPAAHSGAAAHSRQHASGPHPHKRARPSAPRESCESPARHRSAGRSRRQTDGNAAFRETNEAPVHGRSPRRFNASWILFCAFNSVGSSVFFFNSDSISRAMKSSA